MFWTYRSVKYIYCGDLIDYTYMYISSIYITS